MNYYCSKSYFPNLWSWDSSYKILVNFKLILSLTKEFYALAFTTVEKGGANWEPKQEN